MGFLKGQMGMIWAWINETEGLWLWHAGLVMNRLRHKYLDDFRQLINEPEEGPATSIFLVLTGLRRKGLPHGREMIRDGPSLKHSY